MGYRILWVYCFLVLSDADCDTDCDIDCEGEGEGDCGSVCLLLIRLCDWYELGDYCYYLYFYFYLCVAVID